MRRIASCFVLAAAFSAAGFAAGGASAVLGTAPPERTAGSEIICKRTTMVGSRLPVTLCLSKRRWEKMHQSSQRFLGAQP